ncbi:hypothetical protein [Ilumatobacter sp.]|uniref:hypothetical protein n=1 Tax=Ilumatobacter sp. TaxID=1967498 RepID=UPI003B525ED4
MPRRMDIELTSALADGSWTWRAAGARVPKGVLDGGILPDGASVGDELKVEVDQRLDGIEVTSVVRNREKSGPDLLEMLPAEENFQAVIETRARRDRGDRGGRDRGGERGRGRRDDRGRGDGRRRDGDDRGGRGDDRGGRGEGRGGDGRRGPRRPHFDPPPELPQRPKPKRLRPGKARRNEVLASVAEEQRPIAELAVQGMAAVRSRLAEENARLAAAGEPTMPEGSVLKMAEGLIPKLRVADWLDRAEAAGRQMENLDLRDLRSVVAASDDPIVARDEATREIATKLKADLVTKQDQELRLWLEDVDAAITVGRSIRALRLSSQPPKAGVMFPPELARKLAEAATAGLTPDDPPDRWAAVMEAAAFSPVRALVTPTAPPSTITDDLRATALRLGPLLPQLAELLGVEVPADAPRPKPLRPGPRKDSKRKKSAAQGGRDARRDDAGPGRPGRGAGQGPGRGRGAPSPDVAQADRETPGSPPDAERTEPPATTRAEPGEDDGATGPVDAPEPPGSTRRTETGESPTGESPTGESPTGESPTGESPTGESPTGESPTGESRTGESPTGESPTGAPGTDAVDEPES